MKPRHFIDLFDLDAAALRAILDKAKALKSMRGKHETPLAGRTLAMIFEKSSTRTRVSFEVAMLELGGYPLILSSGDMQLGRGETVADTARVLSRYVNAVMIRCNKHATLLEFAQHAGIPVINGLSDKSHPCQIMADIMTFEEKRGPVAGKTIAWVGDGNNVANTFISAAEKFGFHLRLACPKELMPDGEGTRKAVKNVILAPTPEEAVSGADAVLTDTWISMGDTDAERRIRLLSPYQVDAALMAKAKKDAIFLHCLPAHRGEEVTAEVIDGPQSCVWDEAENRLHVQKAILLWVFDLI